LLCFGVGSIESKEEAPAPVLRFLEGRSVSSSTSSSLEDERAGKAIVIFFGARAFTAALEIFDAAGAGFGELGGLESPSLP